MAIVWDENLVTGVETIDGQHREIFRRFDRLISACSEGKGKEEVLQLLDFLKDYVTSHFAAEEALQRNCGYPHYLAHKAEHTAFMRDVDKLGREFKEEGATLSLVIMTNRALTSWLVQHIGKVDMEFAAFLKQRG